MPSRASSREQPSTWADPQQAVDDDLLTLRGKQDTNRITITVGRISVKDIFDNNQYSNDPRGQFMNWALMANAAYDYPADALGFTTGIAIEGNTSNWTLRYGWFQMSKYRNQFTAEGLYLVLPTEPLSGDGKIFYDWGMVTELEHRHTIATHPGAVRLLVFDDRMNNGSYKAAVALANDPATLAIWGTPAAFLASANGVTGGIDDTHALRNTWGLGLNMDQEVTKNIGVFSRIGWNSGQNSGFEFTDTNWTATFGTSIQGEKWKQPDDVIGAAFITSGISKANQVYHAEGGIGILTGDGALNYGPRKKRGTLLQPQIFEVLPRHRGLPVCGRPCLQQRSRPCPRHLRHPPALRALGSPTPNSRPPAAAAASPAAPTPHQTTPPPARQTQSLPRYARHAVAMIAPCGSPARYSTGTVSPAANSISSDPL